MVMSGMTDLPTVTYMEEHQTLHLSAGGTTYATSTNKNEMQ